MLQLSQDEDPYLFEVSEGTAKDVKLQLLEGLAGADFEAGLDDLGRIVIDCCPGGVGCEEVWGAGFREGGNGNQTLGMEWKVIDVIDDDDVFQVDRFKMRNSP